MKLTPHFSLSEVTFSDTGIRLGIDNTLPATLLGVVALVAENILEPIRVKFNTPFSPTSWYRCQELNQAIGGAKNSQHMRGEAVDIRIPQVKTEDLATWIYNNLEFDQLILEHYNKDVPYSGWVHCSCKRYDNRKQHIRIG